MLTETLSLQALRRLGARLLDYPFPMLVIKPISSATDTKSLGGTRRVLAGSSEEEPRSDDLASVDTHQWLVVQLELVLAMALRRSASS
jgi:hypothetical protein